MKITKCPKCGKIITKSDNYCVNCGTDLNQYKTCSKCGKKVNNRDVFCVHCGSKVNQYKKCYICNETSNIDNEYCSFCGSEFNATSKCLKCGQINKEKDKYCINCGEEIDKYKLCLYCGTLLNKNEKFCTNCGKKQNKKKENKNAKDSKNIVCSTKDKKIITSVNNNTNKIVEDEGNEKYATKTKTSSVPILLVSLLIALTIGICVFLFRSYTISYHGITGLINNNPITYRFVDGTIMLSDVKKEGYKFDGWYEDINYRKKVLGIGSMSFGNVDLYAKFSEIEYKVTYDLDGGKNNPLNPSYFTISSGTIDLYEPTKKGYLFGGWYDKKTRQFVYSINSNGKDDVELCAEWYLEYYNINYENMDHADNYNNPYYYTIEDNVVFSEPTWIGHTFMGFYKEGDFRTSVDCITKGTGDITLYAKWDVNSYSIYYDLDGGENNQSNPKTYTYGSHINLRNPKKEGYTFSHWEDNNGYYKTSIEQYDEGDIYLTAIWNGKSYRITYKDTKGAYNPNPTYYESGDYLYLYDLDDYGSYHFNGWYDANGNRKEYLDAVVDKDIILYAKWN